MKRKLRRPQTVNDDYPAWLDIEETPDESAIPFPETESTDFSQNFSAERLKFLAVNMEKGIRDLPVWKDLVARVGIKAARKILRRSVFINRITDGNPEN